MCHQVLLLDITTFRHFTPLCPGIAVATFILKGTVTPPYSGGKFGRNNDIPVHYIRIDIQQFGSWPEANWELAPDT